MPRDRCGVLRRICIDGGELVSFDPQFAYDGDRSGLPPTLPYLPAWRGSWNIPGATNSDAIVGNQVDYSLRLRRASRAEARGFDPGSPGSPGPGSGPSFSRCTLPVLLLADWPYNFGEFFANGATAADHLLRRLRMLPDRSATLVLVTPSGLGLLPFQRALLAHLSSRPLVSLDELAAEAEAAEAAATAAGGAHAPRRVGWSAEGVPVSCFERVVVCKVEGSPQPPFVTASAVVQHLLTGGQGGQGLPPDPLGFGPDQPETLRVLIEARGGGARTIRNLPQLLSACEQPGWRGGPFTRLACRALPAFDTPSLHGSARFRATVAAVRSAHVLVTVHGAGGANSFFLQPDSPAVSAGAGPNGVGVDGGSAPPATARALLEIRPCGFGSGFNWWVDVHMAVHLPRTNGQVRFHAYNLEDPAQCSPADWAAEAAKGGANTRAGLGHMLRDQHVTPRPDGLLAMLAHVAATLRDPAAYKAAEQAKRLHGYALPYSGGGGAAEAAAAAGGAGGEKGAGGMGGEAGGAWGPGGGVVLGPLGVTNLTAHVAAGAEFLLPPG
ncbi:hypothetical protein GPECTOR_19g310 [Gonium pectorale]|uniref:Uncharacterized protein n=1 Tax=Gonium pectorale TaxID=33097 RepID=A0A150GJ87_GONPE|nr:hypothetical protein GPECTOR_19g310 [Gonium pectorale]|eukprot:KXZ49859.1 hypothetical protein GPECTOR_19g310 [Gonium pectorale]